MRRRKSDSGSGTFWFIFIVGGSAFLIMNFPIIFFLVVVPLAVLAIGRFIRWLKK